MPAWNGVFDHMTKSHDCHMETLYTEHHSWGKEGWREIMDVRKIGAIRNGLFAIYKKREPVQK